MRRALMVSVALGLLTSLSAGCAAAGDRVEGLRDAAGELRGGAEDASGDAGFCLSLARAAAAIESGSPATAEEAAEEALARAPDELLDETRQVAELVRRVIDTDEWQPSDPELTTAVEQLGDTARRSCPPG